MLHCGKPSSAAKGAVIGGAVAGAAVGAGLLYWKLHNFILRNLQRAIVALALLVSIPATAVAQYGSGGTVRFLIAQTKYPEKED